MCGFCLVQSNSPSSAASIEQVLASRGPDGRGEQLVNDAWHLHRRLAVIDLSENSAQPYLLDDGSAVLFNGEIYNFKEINRDYFNHLTSSGDTEIFARVLSNGALIPELRGMYAGALSNSQGVRLTRDRFGIKPLYRSNDETRPFTTASQIRCFRHLANGAKVSTSGLASFLQFGSVTHGTIFDGVQEVHVGTTEDWVESRLVQSSNLLPPKTRLDLRDALQQSIERHLVSDVPIAVLLSAGLDSAVIAYLASIRHPNITAVTLSTPEAGDEAPRAAITAEAFHLDHKITTITTREISASIPHFFDAMDQPSIDGLNTFLVTREVQRLGIKVALSGLGSDEIFGGYDSFRRGYLTHKFGLLPTFVWNALIGESMATGTKRKRWIDARRDLPLLSQIGRELFSPEEVHMLCGSQPPNVEVVNHFGDPQVDAQLSLYMSPTLLRDSDAFSMANSVELRVPFLDDDVVAVAMQRSALQRALFGKSALVRELKHPLLKTIYQRPKTGFNLPIADLLSDNTNGFLERAFSEGEPLSRFLDITIARKLCAEGSVYRKWAMVVLNEWLSRNS